MHLKKIIASTCLTLGLTFGGFQPAHSYYIPNQPDKNKGYYVYAGLGAGSLSDSDVTVKEFNLKGSQSYDLAGMVTAGAGYKFNSGFRAELEFANRSNKISGNPPFIVAVGDDDTRYESKSFMANLLYEFRKNKKISPYIGFGLGYSFLKNGGDADQQPAYQGIGGTFIKITEDIDLGIAYKYFSTFDSPTMSVKASPSPVDTEYPYTSHTVEVRGILNF